MMSFFRRFANSPIGLGLFGLIIIAFVVTLYEGKSGMGGTTGTGGDGTVARVGGKDIPEAEMVRRAQNDLEVERQDQPTLDMASFVANGGVERSVELVVNGRALQMFAQQQGMVASKKLIDGAIASIPAFAGPTGQFDRTTFLNLLAARKISENQLREDFAREALSKALVIPASGAARAPAGLVEPYAALLLEARSGQVATLPSGAFIDPAPPTDAELNGYYTRHIARYTIPERRIIRYAMIDKARFAGKSAPSDAEIQSVYDRRRATYHPRETRSFTQVIVPTAAQANQVLAAARTGTPLASAARAVKREAIAVPATSQADFAKLTAPAVAAAGFAAAKGQFAAVAQSGLGFHVVRVDGVAMTAGTPLASVRGTIAADLSRQKEERAMADLVARIEDDVSSSATLDEAAKKNGLSVVTTPALSSTGAAFDGAAAPAAPIVATILPEAFRAEPDDDPAVTALPDKSGYALWKLDRVQPPSPQPLAKVRDQVVLDVRVEKASLAAKRAADAVATAVNGGKPFAQALAGIGRKLPPVSPVTATRMEIARAQQVPPPIALMFAMPERRARVLQLPKSAGWYIVYLDKITRGDAKTQPALIAGTQQQFARVIGSEYVEQFARAARQAVGATINQATVARIKRNLVGSGTGQ